MVNDTASALRVSISESRMSTLYSQSFSHHISRR